MCSARLLGIVMFCVVSVTPTWAESIWLGQFEPQAVVYQGSGSGFCAPGTLLQTVSSEHHDQWGPRYLLTDSWTMLPLGTDWVTRAVMFHVERLSGGVVRLLNPWVEGLPLTYAALDIDDGGSFDIHWTGHKLDVRYLGYTVGQARVWKDVAECADQRSIPEPAPLGLLVTGIALLIVSRRIRPC